MDNQHKIELLKQMMLNIGFNKVEVVDTNFCNVPYYQIRYAMTINVETIYGSFEVSVSSFKKIDNSMIIKELINGDKRLWKE